MGNVEIKDLNAITEVDVRFEGVMNAMAKTEATEPHLEVEEVVENVVSLFPDTGSGPIMTNRFPGTQPAFLQKMKQLLSEDDYVDILEGIVSYDMFADLDDDLQTIVLHYFALGGS